MTSSELGTTYPEALISAAPAAEAGTVYAEALIPSNLPAPAAVLPAVPVTPGAAPAALQVANWDRPVAWSYAATDLVTGRVLATKIPLTVQSCSMQLNGGGSLTGTLNLSEIYTANAPFLAALECQRAVLWVLQNGYPVWNGVVWDQPDMTRAQGSMPVTAQTMDSFLSRRVISSTLNYQLVDLFTVAADLIQYATTKKSRYISPVSPIQGPPSDLVAQQVRVAGLVYPAGQAAVSGTLWRQSFLWSDLTVVSDALNGLAQSGNFEYVFAPGLDASGNLVTFIRFGWTKLGRGYTESGFSVTYPGNCSDYGFQRTGSQGGNAIWATAPPNGSLEQWESQYPHGYDITNLQAGYPLLETTVSMQGSIVLAQSQVDAFADGQISLRSQAMTTPVLTIPGGTRPGLLDLTLGDVFPVAFTSARHPPGPGNTPGFQGLLRLTGWTAYPPGPRQSESLQLQTSAILDTTGGGT